MRLDPCLSGFSIRENSQRFGCSGMTADPGVARCAQIEVPGMQIGTERIDERTVDQLSLFATVGTDNALTFHFASLCLALGSSALAFGALVLIGLIGDLVPSPLFLLGNTGNHDILLFSRVSDEMPDFEGSCVARKNPGSMGEREVLRSINIELHRFLRK
nr:hypothetical protein [Allochromatium humboldtianum]